MTNFICKVMTPQGQIVKVKLKDNDKISVMKKLKKNGMTPNSIETSAVSFKERRKITATIHSRKKRKFDIKNSFLDRELFKKVSIDEVREFTEDLLTLKKSNFTDKHALMTILNKTDNEYFREIIKAILDGVEDGKYIYKTMKEYKKVFPVFYRNLIKTGELTNSLEESLGYAITYLEDEGKLRHKIRTVLFPNIYAFIGIIFLLFFSIAVVIPNLQTVFQGYGINMALPSILLLFSKLIRIVFKYWYLMFVIVAIFIGLFIKFVSTDSGRYKFDHFRYNNFLLGKLAFILDFSRVIRSIFLNLKNKMRLEDALEISKNITKNTCMISIIEKSINNLYVGKKWYDSFEDEKMINPIILELLKKGTKAKSLYTIDTAIQYIDKEIEKELDRVLRLLPEISYILVGIVLLIFVITILIPCMQIYLGGFLFI